MAASAPLEFSRVYQDWTGPAPQWNERAIANSVKGKRHTVARQKSDDVEDTEKEGHPQNRFLGKAAGVFVFIDV